MRNNFLFLAVALFFAACNSSNTPITITDSSLTTDTSKPVENTIQVANKTCYAYIRGKDTVLLTLEKFPNVVTGRLVYKLFEKDASEGDIDGKLNGDTLIADYTFKAEGITSVRQVAFLIKDSAATEGYTDMENKDGKMIFKNTDKINFSKTIKLKQTACTE